MLTGVFQRKLQWSVLPETGIADKLPPTPEVGAQRKALKFPAELAGKEKSRFLISIYSLK